MPHLCGTMAERSHPSPFWLWKVPKRGRTQHSEFFFPANLLFSLSGDAGPATNPSSLVQQAVCYQCSASDTFGLNVLAAAWKALPCSGSLQHQHRGQKWGSSKGRWLARCPQWFLIDNRGLRRCSGAVLISVPPVPCCSLSPCSEGEAGRSFVDAKEKDAASRHCSSTSLSGVCSTEVHKQSSVLWSGAGWPWGRHKCAVSNRELKAFTIKPSALHSLITTCLVHWLR